MTATKVLLRTKRADVLDSYRHPWIFSKGLVEQPDFPVGTQVRVVSQDGRHMGHAFYHPKNPIALRMVTFGMDPMDAKAWQKRIAEALGRRKALMPNVTCFRLIHGENDGFPGLTVDCYNKLLVVQINSAGFDIMKAELASWLMKVTGATAVYEASDNHARRQEGLENHHGFLAGSMEFPYQIEDNGFKLNIDPTNDQKTGFYLDQRPARAWLETHAKGLRILDLCCYTGGFTLPALRGGAAHVLSIDSSERALATLDENIRANGLDSSRQTSLKTDAFAYLKATPEELYDLVILDPPSMAKSVKAEERARKGYRQLNRSASHWVKPGGMMLTFSCTGVVNADVFGRSVFLGLRDARREAMVVSRFGAGPDHPENLAFPEGSYLKGLLMQLP